MKLTPLLAAFGLLGVTGLSAPEADAQERYLGEIITFGGNFCPRGMMKAEGQLLPIAQNTALFSLYGTFYGGDGRTTFALPDLRGRSFVGAGQGPGLENQHLGQKTTQSVSKEVDMGSNRTIAPSLAINFCVVTQGIYPSRS